MKHLSFVSLLIFAVISTATAGAELVSDNYFPADSEFADLQKISSEITFADPARLLRIDNGQLFSDVGFEKYAKRVYTLGNSGSLSVEIITLRDARAAYSVLTLLRSGDIYEGPPGDSFTKTADGIRFAQGKQWVCIQGHGASADLDRRVAMSVSNRIGPHTPKPPSLVSHLPKFGYEPASLRYYPSIQSFQSYSGAIKPKHFRLDSDVEIAQAQYAVDEYTGTLYLLSFPTSEVAEDYLGGLAGEQSAGKGADKVYAKRAGPIIGVLEGSFDPGTADKILGSIKYSYLIKWVYQKTGKPKTVWGIPAGILTTVVKSLFFVVLLAGIAIIAGIVFALVRIMYRRYRSKQSPDQPEQDEMTQLKLL